jgi:hypothetical protein
MREVHNPNCDGSHCRSETGEVRVLPTSRDPHGGNIILCRSCLAHEVQWRKERNKDLAEEARFPLPSWESLEVYSSAPMVYRILRDGAEVARVSPGELMEWFHKNTASSMEWGIKHEGYSYELFREGSEE